MSLRAECCRLAEAYRGGRRLGLFFDYDGTLSPIMAHPALALCPESTLRLLKAFCDLPRVQVGVISGRALVNLMDMIRLPGIIYAGTCGLEVETPAATWVHPRAEQFRPFFELAADALRPVIERFPGAWLETKPLGLTVHYRGVCREDTALFQQCLVAPLSSFEGLLEVHDGSLATEILPALDWNKGDALRMILDLQADPTLPFYAGNDANDQEALRLAAVRDGVSVGIGPVAPATAVHRLSDVESLAEELSILLRQLTR